MNNLQKTLLVAGAIGLGSVVAAPAFAGDVQAYASGSVTIVQMNGASQSVGGEIAAPAGVSFANASVIVTPSTVDPSINTNVYTTLDVNPGPATGTPSVNSSVEAAVATIITAAYSTVSDDVSLIRAWKSGLQ